MFEGSGCFSCDLAAGPPFPHRIDVTVLAELEKKTGRSVASSFDLIAGTSIGGIVALGLAADATASRIKSVFETNGARIFGNRPPPTSSFGVFKDIVRGAFTSKYETSALRETIESIVGKDTHTVNP